MCKRKKDCFKRVFLGDKGTLPVLNGEKGIKGMVAGNREGETATKGFRNKQIIKGKENRGMFQKGTKTNCLVTLVKVF